MAPELVPYPLSRVLMYIKGIEAVPFYKGPYEGTMKLP